MSQAKTIMTLGGQRKAKISTAHIIQTILIIICLVLIALIALIPFFWMISASLKANKDVFQYPIKWIPSHIYWSNYILIQL